MFLRNMNFMLIYGVFQLLSLLKICMYPPSGEKKKRKSGNIIPPTKTINKEKVKKKINSD